ncbi:GerMN domain-containing protein [Blastococcus sp. SYSU D01042]
MRGRAGLPALLAAVVLALTSCSIVPTSSPTVPITQAPERPVQNGGFEPLPPAPDATPEEVVRGFIDAAASTVRGRPVAAEYLAPDAARAWSDATSITIIGQGYATVAGEGGSVEVTATQVGGVDQRGVFTVAGAEPYSYAFPLAEVDGEWRITDPPDVLVMLESDFERLYHRVEAYFPDPTLQRLVPDPRYLIRGEAQPTALVERLIEGASGPLARSVANPLEGARLARTVTVEDQTARVDLADVVVEPATPLREMCAQLVWTLTQLEDVGIRAVEITADGEPLDCGDVPQQQTTDDWAVFDPDASPLAAVGHYVDAGGLRRTTDGQPAPGPAGQPGAGLTSAAVSADPRTGQLTFLVGVRSEPGGASLVRGRYDGELLPVLPAGGTLSAPTVAATSREVWVVRNGVEIVRMPEDGPPQGVGAPTLATSGRTAQTIELSPDSVRLAVVAADPQGVRRLYVATVVREPQLSVQDLIEVTPGLTSVIDVAWRSPGELWVLAGQPDQQQLYSVGVDGWDLSTVGRAGLPARPTSLAAAPGRPPLVVAGESLWQWSDAGQRWVTLLRGQEPVRGSAPFYPQ